MCGAFKPFGVVSLVDVLCIRRVGLLILLWWTGCNGLCFWRGQVYLLETTHMFPSLMCISRQVSIVLTILFVVYQTYHCRWLNFLLWYWIGLYRPILWWRLMLVCECNASGNRAWCLCCHIGTQNLCTPGCLGFLVGWFVLQCSRRSVGMPFCLLIVGRCGSVRWLFAWFCGDTWVALWYTLLLLSCWRYVSRLLSILCQFDHWRCPLRHLAIFQWSLL